MLPTWKTIRINNLANILSEIWVMDYVAPNAMIVRFVGSNAERICGNTTGEDFLNTYIAAENRAALLDIYKTVHEARCSAILTRTVSDPGEPYRAIISTVFPLAGDGPDSWSLIGISEITNAAQTDDQTGYDFEHTALAPPVYKDIGFGLPDQAYQCENTNAYVKKREGY